MDWQGEIGAVNLCDRAVPFRGTLVCISLRSPLKPPVKIEGANGAMSCQRK
jgi:hypothetical protein